MKNKDKNMMPNQEEARRRRRTQVRNWLILIGVVVLIIGGVNLVNLLTRTTSVSALSLPCYAHQDVTAFQDGVLYYDGASIHFVNAGGGIEWSYPVGEGAAFDKDDLPMDLREVHRRESESTEEERKKPRNKGNKRKIQLRENDPKAG